MENSLIHLKNKHLNQSSQLLSFSIFKNYCNVRDLEKVSSCFKRNTKKHTRNSRVQNAFDPEMTEEYITQAPEEIEERVTEKLS